MHFKVMIALAAVSALLGTQAAVAQQRMDRGTGQPSYQGSAPMQRDMGQSPDATSRREYYPREATDKGDVRLRPEQRAQADAAEAETTRRLNEEQLRRAQ